MSQWLGLAAGAATATGLVVIALFASATPGPHLQYFSVAVLTALAALLAGYLVGFLFGVPRVVSSGELRLRRRGPKVITTTATASTATRTVVTGSAAGDASGTESAPDVVPGEPELPNPAASEFEPSTNLSEVSDWLTKLLLGAGLVQLAALGRALRGLVDRIAQAFTAGSASGAASSSAAVFAGAILVAYFVLGFLFGYHVTTLWYGRRVSGM